MMKVKGIFAVSLIAMMVVGGAYAEIASSGYVDEKIDGLATVAKTGAYGDLSGAPTVNNATLTIQKNGTSAGTFTANASANRTINITVPTKTSELNNDSGFITSANLPVATANTLGGVKSYFCGDQWRRDREPRDQGRYCNKCNKRSVRHQGDTGRVRKCDYINVCNENRGWF